MYVSLLSAVCIWSSVWEIQTCGSSCAFLLQVLAGPSVEMCMPACGSSQVCGPACASSACAYLVVVIGVGSRGPACTSPVCATRPFGRNVGAGLRQFSNLRPGLHSKFGPRCMCAPACARYLAHRLASAGFRPILDNIGCKPRERGGHASIIENGTLHVVLSIF